MTETAPDAGTGSTDPAAGPLTSSTTDAPANDPTGQSADAAPVETVGTPTQPVGGSPAGATTGEVTPVDPTSGNDELPDHVAVQQAVSTIAGHTAPLQNEAAPYPDGRRRILVQPGDTLESLAGREGANVADVYALNARVLEDQAQARGFAGSDNGRVVFAGTVLVLP